MQLPRCLMWLCILSAVQCLLPIYQSDKKFLYLTLSSFFSRLRKEQLVDSVRGPGGGYLLGRQASEIAIGEVIRAVDESIDATRCQGQADCQGGDRCLTHSLWQDLSDRISVFLNSITLGELMAKRDVQEVAGRQDNNASLRNITNDIEVSIQL